MIKEEMIVRLLKEYLRKVMLSYFYHLQNVSSRKGVKVFKLQSVTKPLERTSVDRLTIEAFKRVLYAEGKCGLFHL